MRYLLDTHIVIWALADTRRLPSKAVALLSNDANELWVSVVTPIEIAIKNSIGRDEKLLDLTAFDDACERAGLVELALSTRAARELESLPLHHRDPFDRLLVAQALAASMKLLTTDKTLTKYGSMIEYVGE